MEENYHEVHEFYWEGLKLADFQCLESYLDYCHFTLWTPDRACHLERPIFSMLGLGRASLLSYMSNEQKRRAIVSKEQEQEL
jgi:hypothetical protein